MGRMVKITLLLASTLTVMAGAAIAPALPTIAKYFSNVAQVDLLTKLLLTLPALFIALFSPLIGYLIDRAGKLQIFQLSMVLYILAGTAGFFLSNLYWLLVSRALLGIAVAGIMTIAVTLAGDYFEGNERNRFLGTQAAIMAFGGTVFVTLSGLLADIGWRFPFLIYALALPVLILVNLFLKEPSRDSPLSSDSNSGGGAFGPGFSMILLIYATAFVGMIIFYIIPVQSPFLLEQIGADRPSLQSVGLIGATILAAVMAQSYGWIIRSLGFRGVFAICFGLMSIGFLVTAAADHYLQAVIGLFVAGGGVGLLMPNSNTWLMELAPANVRGRAMGVLTMAIFFGQFLSPVFFEPVVRIQGLQNAHWTVGIFLSAISLGYLVNRITTKRN